MAQPNHPQYGQPDPLAPGPYGQPAHPHNGHTLAPHGSQQHTQPPQQGQPQYGQPQYGQPGQPYPPQQGQPQQYAQPQYGQPQPQYGQPQPQYGQPQYAQPQYAQPGQLAAPAYGPPPQGYAPTAAPYAQPGQPPAHPQSGQVGLTCRCCGASPAINATIRGHRGMIVVMQFRSMKGPFCKDCGIATVRNLTADTLWQGWWGFGSLLATPVTLAINAVQRGRLAGLAEPMRGHDAHPPMDKGNPIYLRPAILGVLVPLVIVVCLAASAFSG